MIFFSDFKDIVIWQLLVKKKKEKKENGGGPPPLALLKEGNQEKWPTMTAYYDPQFLC